MQFQKVVLAGGMSCLGGTCNCCSLSVTVLALCEGNVVVSFLCFQFSKKNSRTCRYVVACLTLPSYTCTSSANNFTTCLREREQCTYAVLAFRDAKQYPFTITRLLSSLCRWCVQTLVTKPSAKYWYALSD